MADVMRAVQMLPLAALAVCVACGALVVGWVAQDRAAMRAWTQHAVEVERERDAWRGLADSLPGGVILVNERGIMEYANEGAEEITLHRRRDLIGSSVRKLVPDGYWAAHSPRFSDVMMSRSLASGPALFLDSDRGRIVRKDGTTARCELRISVFAQEPLVWLVFIDPTTIRVIEPESSDLDSPEDKQTNFSLPDSSQPMPTAVFFGNQQFLDDRLDIAC